jgi:methionyl-tRNA synthetase
LLWAPNLVCGDIYGQLSGEGVNAFDPDSEVKTVTSFGIDNAVPFLVGVLGTAIEQERYKPFDHYLVNYFYNLEGSKFSTNRGHVIWAADIIGLTPVGSDLVRFYLTLVNPEFEGQNFDVADFVDFNNRTVREIERSVRDSLRKRGERTSSSPSPRLLSRLEALIADQDAALDPSAFALKGASEAALRWLSEKDRLARDPNDHTWWLKSTALLLYPIMPKLSRVLWATCGHEKEPTTAAFLEVRNPGPAPRSLPLGSEINAKDLEPCLPGTLGEVRTGKTP